MAYDPKYNEPCHLCGREYDECICALAPDIPDSFDPLAESESDAYFDEWGKEETE